MWPYLRWLKTLKDVTFAANLYHILASTVSITAARCKCSLSPKDIPFPKAVLCQDESSVFQFELTQTNSTEVHGKAKLGYIDLYMVKASFIYSLANSVWPQQSQWCYCSVIPLHQGCVCKFSTMCYYRTNWIFFHGLLLELGSTGYGNAIWDCSNLSSIYRRLP